MFFFNDTATTEIYTLSLHDALPISVALRRGHDGDGHEVRRKGRPGLIFELGHVPPEIAADVTRLLGGNEDGKSTRLNSSHANISYAAFCLKKKKQKHVIDYQDSLIE